MQRQQQLKYCKVCKNQGFNIKEGVICKLTEARADFKDVCPDYILDEALLEKREKAQVQSNIQIEKETNNTSIVMGVLAMVGGAIWFFGALIWMDRIFFYPPILFIGGIVSVVKGVNEAKRKKQKKNLYGDMLDSDLI